MTIRSTNPGKQSKFDGKPEQPSSPPTRRWATAASSSTQFSDAPIFPSFLETYALRWLQRR